jgi:hypothetical protein
MRLRFSWFETRGSQFWTDTFQLNRCVLSDSVFFATLLLDSYLMNGQKPETRLRVLVVCW